MSDDLGGELRRRIETIEESYEFMLAYAAQGVSGEGETGEGSDVRGQLRRSDEAIDGVAGLMREVIDAKKIEPAPAYHAFIDVLERDAGAARAAIRLVLAQAAISSQLIDNLNALIHLRALLTDLFLIDEVLKL